MSGLEVVLPDSRVLLVAYGVVEVAAGTALLLLPRSLGDDRFIRFWPFLVAHLLIHSAGDFLAAASLIPSETATPGPFALTTLSYLPLFEFGRRLLASRWQLPRATRWSLPLLLAVVVGVAALSDDPRAVANPLIGYLVRFPGGVMTGVGLMAVAGDTRFGAGFSRLCISAGVIALLWSVACGLIRPEAGFFPANWLNEATFEVFIGVPVIVFRLLLAAVTVGLVVAIGRSIGSHRLALLRENEARYRAVVQTANSAIITADSAGNIVGWNQAATSLFGYTEAEIGGQPLTLLIPYRYQERHRAAMHRLRSGGEPRIVGKIVELEGRRKDTSEFPLELAVAKWESTEGWFVTGIIRDITERRQAEGALRLQSTALNAAANAMVITDRNGTIAWVNSAFTSLTGYDAEEAIGQNPRDLVKSGVHDQAFFKHLWKTILGGDVWHGEITNRRKNGSRYSEALTITPVKHASGEITHFIAVKRDLTEEHQLQAQFLQAQKMESVGLLAGGIAHDFNNLLTVINGTADLASTNLSEGDPLREDFRQIQQAGERAALLTRQLLAFSRKQILRPGVLNLSTLVAEMQGMLQRLIGEDLDLVVVPAKDVGNVRVDPGQIEQVIMNLAVNARDAMPNGGTLTIETHDIELDEAYAAEHPSVQPGPHVMLAMSDTGVGMDEATRMRIFEPFFTTKELGKGTGLGLSTVYGIVKQSGGSIWVYSEIGRGTTFKIYLPRVGEVVRTDQLARTRAAVPGNESILIVEDDEALRSLAARMLQVAGYTVLTASNGGEASLLLERHDGPVHLMLTDVVMPGLSGPDLATRMADAHPEIKVLYTSGYTDDTVLRHGVLDDVTHFIGKPFTAAELTRKVREVLDL